MVDWPRDQRMKEGLHGTFMNNPIYWSIIDLVVLAGSPEFLHHPLAPIYEGLAEHPEIPLFAIGVGYSEPDWLIPITEAEKKVLSRRNTLIISRQYDLSERLINLLNREVHTLPCPALFCFNEFPHKTHGILYWQEIAHSLDELTADAYFSSDPYDMLNYIGKHLIVQSKRLHGAIAAISSGAHTTLLNNSFRAQSAIRLFEDVLEAKPEKIKQFKDETLSKYLKIIKSF